MRRKKGLFILIFISVLLFVKACVYFQWDKDWDLRDPVSVVRQPKGQSEEKLAEYEKELEKAKPKVIHLKVNIRLFLIYTTSLISLF